MTQPEQSKLAVIVGVGGAVVALGLFYFFYWVPSEAIAGEIDGLDKEIQDKRAVLNKLVEEKRHLERYRLMSLPPDAKDAQEYIRFLEPLLKKSGLEDVAVTPQKVVPKAALGPGKKPPPHKVVPYVVEAKGDLAHLVKFLVAMDQAPIVHRVKVMSLASESSSSSFASPGRLTIRMTIEGLIVHGSDKRSRNLTGPDNRLAALNALSALRGGPTGIALVPWALSPTGPLDQHKTAVRPGLASRLTSAVPDAKRKKIPFTQEQANIRLAYYDDLVKRNIFLGGQPMPVEPLDPSKKTNDPNIDPDTGLPYPTGPDIRQFVKLSMIVHDPKGEYKDEAYLQFHNEVEKFQKLLSEPKSGFEKFVIWAPGRRALVEGLVLHIDERNVYFKAKDKIYAITMGQTMEEAMQQPLIDDRHSAVGGVVMEAAVNLLLQKPEETKKKQSLFGGR